MLDLVTSCGFRKKGEGPYAFKNTSAKRFALKLHLSNCRQVHYARFFIKLQNSKCTNYLTEVN